jgi:hypothetical protein
MDNPSALCEHCGAAFAYRLLHNGFNDSAYGYCDKCSFAVMLNGYTHEAQRVSLRVHQRITPGMEPLLKPCPSGGKFSASAEPKCPHCSQPLSATKATDYIERNAPGTAKGWRWQHSWSGLYSVVLNENVVEDWWDEQAVDRLKCD